VGMAVAASGFLSPPFALAEGLVFGLTVAHPLPEQAKKLSRMLLQASVVALGFGMNLAELIRAGSSGILYTAAGIALAMLLGLLLGRLLRVSSLSSYLIAAGTSICGGSAIAAVGPIVRATDEDMSVSLGTVFTLNSVALFLFPFIGHVLGLTQAQFGLWSALAIHDTSSVVGATAKYGPTALAVGTAVKLARALWIVPLSIASSIFLSRCGANRTVQGLGKMNEVYGRWPWFIGLFCLAALANTCLPQLSATFKAFSHLGRIGLVVTLFLIGSGISRATVRQVGLRPFVQGIVLWAVVAVSALLLIRSGAIHV